MVTGSLPRWLLRGAKNALLADRFDMRTVRRGVARGARLPLNLRFHTGTVLGFYEREAAPWLRERMTGDCVLYDVGAGLGYYAVAFARRLTTGKVYAFEFDPPALELLRQAIEVNAVGDRVEVVEAAVAERTDGGAGLVSLDDFVAGGARPPTLLKIDVEGAELEVLRGAHAVLDRYRPALFVEVHSRELDEACAALLRSHGYRPEFLEPGRWLRWQRPLEFNRWILAS